MLVRIHVFPLDMVRELIRNSPCINLCRAGSAIWSADADSAQTIQAAVYHI